MSIPKQELASAAFKLDEDDKGFTMYLKLPDGRILAKTFAEPFKAEGVSSGRYAQDWQTWSQIMGEELAEVKSVFTQQEK